jgi:hypothetical protein
MPIENVMSEGARNNYWRKVLKSAIQQFPTLRGSVVVRGVYHCDIAKKVLSTQRVGILWKRTKQTQKYETLIHTYDNTDEATLEITSYHKKYDDAAIWIAAQLEKLYEYVKVVIHNPEKLHQAISWRCAYCNMLNEATQKQCSKCGAPQR